MIVAGGMTMLLALLAVSVDMGSAYLASRRLQGITDAAALAAAGDSGDADSAARRAIAANGWTQSYTLALVPGRYTPDPAIAPSARFVAGGGGTAMRVTLTTTTPTFFAAAIGAPRALTIHRGATATRTDLAAFSIGSRLASINGGVANALLSALLGTSVNLSAMDYDALLGADIDALSFADALRSELHLDAASFNDALAADVTMPQALAAMADALAGGGQAGAAATLRKIAAQAGRAADIRLGDLIDLGPYGPQDHAGAGAHVAVDAYEMLSATLALASGAHQIQLDLGAGVPGLASTKVLLAIGERSAHSPWLTVSDHGDPIIRTAQTRLYIQSTLPPPAALAMLGVPSLALPLYVELAEAQARLAAISCPGGGANAAVTLSVLPGVGHASIAAIDPATLDNFGAIPAESPAAIARAPMFAVTGQTRVDLSAAAWQDVSFSAADIAAGRIRTVSSSGIATAVATSLIQRINLQASTLGFGINAGAVAMLVGATLQPAEPALDGLVDQLTLLLGLRYGEADVRVDGVRCGQPVLVM